MERSTWTDERLDEKMTSIDDNFALLRAELREFRSEMRSDINHLRSDVDHLRGDVGGLRSEFTTMQGRLIQIGFSLVGVLIASMVALIVAVA